MQENKQALTTRIAEALKEPATLEEICGKVDALPQAVKLTLERLIKQGRVYRRGVKFCIRKFSAVPMRHTVAALRNRERVLAALINPKTLKELVDVVPLTETPIYYALQELIQLDQVTSSGIPKVFKRTLK